MPEISSRVASLLLLAVLSTCALRAEADSAVPEDPLTQAVVLASNALASDVYAQLRSASGNIAFAPLGLSQSLLPIAAGAHGATGEEARQTLRLETPPAEAADGLALLTRRLQEAAGGESNLAFVRALWVRQWNSLNPEYVEFLRHHCRSELRVLDFGQPEAAVQWMNRWIAERTENRFPVWLEAARQDADSCLVVGSAVWFRGRWQSVFDPALTELGSFFPGEPATAAAPGAGPVPGAVAAAHPIVVPMMRRVAPLRIGDAAGCRVLELPYNGGQFSLVIVAPQAGEALEQVERQVTAAQVAGWRELLRGAVPTLVELRLPRFKVERALPLGSLLHDLGLHLAFDRAGGANFSVLGENYDGRPIYVSQVSQQIGMCIDETGGLAVEVPRAEPEMPFDAAVGAPPVIAIDRPFLYFLCHNPTGALLFLGRVVDPRAG